MTRRVWTLMAACSLLVACTASGTGPSGVPSLTSDPARLRLLTQESPSPSVTCMQTRVGGTLVEDSISGLGLRQRDGSVMPVAWPFGYTALRGADGVALIGPEGVVARVGDRVGLDGGVGGPDDT